MIKMPENREIRKKFQEALDAFIVEVKQDDSITAALLFGSLVKGTVWEKSDIDLVLITKDQKTPYKNYWLMDGDITLQVSIMTRNQFIRNQQRALQGSGTHHVLSTSKILFSNDETLDEFIESMKNVGSRDLQLRILSIVSMIIGDMEKAEKFLFVKDDLLQSYLFITRLLDNLASIIVMLNNEIPGREAVEQAMHFEPKLFEIIFADAITSNLTKEKLELILSTIKNYLVVNTECIFEPIIDYMKKEATFRSVTDIANFLNDRLSSQWWEIGAVGIGNWLVEQGYLERVPSPVRLTLRSHKEVNEIGYYYSGVDEI